MKKTILLALLLASFTLGGCVQQTPSENQNLNQPAADQNQNVNQPVVDGNQNTNQGNANADHPVVNTNQNVNTAPQVDPIANWKTHRYRTDAYGFEVKYPGTWKVSETGDQNGGYVSFIPSALSGADTCIVLFGYPGKTISEAEKVLPVLSVPGRKIDSRSNVNINNINWIKLTIGNQIILLTYKNFNTYGVQSAIPELDSDNCSQILSTYKITN